MKNGLIPLICLAAVVFSASCQNDSVAEKKVSLAVASNFMETAKELAATYTNETGVEVILVSGSTGKLSAQIQQGAPFDVFLSADSAAPRHLAEKGFAMEETRFTYALGRLVLYSPSPELVSPGDGFPALTRFRHLAIANPELAPYGRAARETLIALGHWEALQGKIVRGENIAQTWHFVSSGNAELGLVAASQVKDSHRGATWLIPAELHTPIEQDAILIHDTPQARLFLEHSSASDSRELIESHRYALPPLSHAE